MWSHLWYAGDVFVSADEVFHKPSRRAALLALGAKAIVRPQDALSAARAVATAG